MHASEPLGRRSTASSDPGPYGRRPCGEGRAGTSPCPAMHSPDRTSPAPRHRSRHGTGAATSTTMVHPSPAEPGPTLVFDRDAARRTRPVRQAMAVTHRCPAQHGDQLLPGINVSDRGPKQLRGPGTCRDPERDQRPVTMRPQLRKQLIELVIGNRPWGPGHDLADSGRGAARKTVPSGCDAPARGCLHGRGPGGTG
jgi:hypothetical protein